MMVMTLPRNKPLRGKPQKNSIRNRMHGLGSHNPCTNPNEANYKLRLWATIIQSIIIPMYHENSYVNIYGEAHGLYQ